MTSVPFICLTCLTLIQVSSVNTYDLRSSRMNLIVPKVRTNYFRNSFASAGAKLWNSLPSSLMKETSFKQFRLRSGLVYVVVQFYPWFNVSPFCFELIIIHYHTQKQREIKFKPKIKLNHDVNYLHKHHNFSFIFRFNIVCNLFLV